MPSAADTPARARAARPDRCTRRGHRCAARLQDALARAAQGLEQAAAAIIVIVDTYADTDAAAKASLLNAWRNGPPPDMVIGDTDPVPTSPPTVVFSA
jgi:hypothetical protein